jgi:hypothetical protein
MKKQLALALLATLALSVSASAASRGAAGCGLGNMLFKNEPGMVQILAATTNGTSGNQTFGITSGTSDCADGGSSSKQASLFITVNQEALKKDIARGQGETLAGLSQIMNCSDTAMLGATLQQNYAEIFPSAQTSADQVSQSIMGLAQGCSI